VFGYAAAEFHNTFMDVFAANVAAASSSVARCASAKVAF
jgi:hypothetical protein